jgi:hypothetical protein
METVNKTKIKSGFGNDRKAVKARCWNGVGLSSWKEMEITQCTDEGKNIVSIGKEKDIVIGDLKEDVSLFFMLEDIPALIATLTKVAEDTQKVEFKNQVAWELEDLNKNK